MKNILSRFTHSEFFRILLLKWDAVTVSLVAICFGGFLILHPQLLDKSETYEILSYLFTSKVFGILFLLIGFSKILSIVINSKILKILSISLLVGMWILFGSALYQNDSLNTVYIHCFGWAAISFGVIVREWVANAD